MPNSPTHSDGWVTSTDPSTDAPGMAIEGPVGLRPPPQDRPTRTEGPAVRTLGLIEDSLERCPHSTHVVSHLLGVVGDDSTGWRAVERLDVNVDDSLGSVAEVANTQLGRPSRSGRGVQHGAHRRGRYTERHAVPMPPWRLASRRATTAPSIALESAPRNGVADSNGRRGRPRPRSADAAATCTPSLENGLGVAAVAGGPTLASIRCTSSRRPRIVKFASRTHEGLPWMSASRHHP